MNSNICCRSWRPFFGGSAIAILFAATLLSKSGAASFTGTTYDGFDYTDATLISASLNGGTGWNPTGDPLSANTTAWGSNTTGTNDIAHRGIATGSLSYTA